MQYSIAFLAAIAIAIAIVLMAIANALIHIRFSKVKFSSLGKSSLVVCCELNSMILNYPERSGMDQMVKYAIFGDGCAAAVLSAQELQPGDGKWIVEGIFLALLLST